eukprot:COSAG04_NODE_4370_length_2134_cov_1.742998_1_plen_76_part_10
MAPNSGWLQPEPGDGAPQPEPEPEPEQKNRALGRPAWRVIVAPTPRALPLASFGRRFSASAVSVVRWFLVAAEEEE